MARPKRIRVDDEEALIPRSDMEEFHTTTRKKVNGRCSCCCGLKCWFAMFFLLITASTVVFYFVYPSVVHDNLNKIMDFACGFVDKPNATITCLIMTSPAGIATNATSVSKTWTKQCTATYFFYQGAPVSTLPNSVTVDDLTSLEPLTVALNRSDTSWYLFSNDQTYVVQHRLQKLLTAQQFKEPTYFGNAVKQEDVGAYILNKEAARLLISRSKVLKTEKILDAIPTNMNESNCHQMDFTVDYPSVIADPTKIELLEKAIALRNVPVDLMYAFHAVNNEV